MAVSSSAAVVILGGESKALLLHKLNPFMLLVKHFVLSMFNRCDHEGSAHVIIKFSS